MLIEMNQNIVTLWKLNLWLPLGAGPWAVLMAVWMLP